MGLTVYLIETKPVRVFDTNITHNLGRMAEEAGLYEYLWRPDEIYPAVVRAEQLIKPLQTGIAEMKADPARFKKFDSNNGWGTYDTFVPWLESYLAACVENPDAKVEVCR